MKYLDARILYAEDDADTRELVTVIFESQNCQVIATEICDEALCLARTERFDLYLIDNWLPGCSGVSLCEQLREFDQHTPVLFYSAAAYEADRERAFLSGAQGYLVKPVDGEELVAAVFRLISASRESLMKTVWPRMNANKNGSETRQQTAGE
ncbi:MAG TPA: response regulator [Pyrinomonadaceae bacterium]|nr:response regulator [Pyrinomonadaceae bacterium]